MTAASASEGYESGSVHSKVEQDLQGKPDAEKAESSGPNDGPPDGGFDAWMVLAGTWCCSFCCYGWINSIGIFQAHYQTHQLKYYSESTISWITSLELFFMLVGSPIIGKIYDSFGTRYLLLFGSFTHVLGLMMASISSKYYQFLLSQGVCSAIGASCIFTPAISALGTWFGAKRGLAFGIAMSGSSVGGVIFPIMVTHIISKAGFGWAMRAAAFMILGLLIFANLTVRSRVLPRPNDPTTLKEFFSPLQEKTFALTSAGLFILQFGLFIPINYIILQAIDQGMSVRLANYLVPILNAASLFGRIIPGYFADRIGRYNIFVCVTIFTAIITLALWIPASSNAAVIVFALLFGFGSGAFISLSPALIAQISPLPKMGVRQGLAFFMMSWGSLFTSPIGGAIVSHESGSYLGIKIFAGVFLMAAAVLFALARWVAIGAAPSKRF